VEETCSGFVQEEVTGFVLEVICSNAAQEEVVVVVAVSCCNFGHEALATYCHFVHEAVVATCYNYVHEEVTCSNSASLGSDPAGCSS
jgi:hypothetical protein